MAKTPDFIGSSLRVTKWEDGAARSLFSDTGFGRMFKQGTISIPAEAQGKRPGDTITMGYLNNPVSPGVGEGGTLDGNEEILDYESFSFNINEHRKAELIAGEYNIERFRSTQDFDMDAYHNVSRYFNGCIDASCFQQLAGAYPTQITVEDIVFAGNDRILVTGNNSVDALDSSRLIRAGGVANDQSLTSADTLRLDYLDVMLEKARSTPAIQPFNDGNYDFYCSPEQWLDLKRDNSGKVQLLEILTSEIQGGKNNLLNEGKGIQAAKVKARYDNINIIVCDRVAYGVNSSTSASISNTRRAVFVGKKALAFGSPVITSSDLTSLTVENSRPIIMKQEYKDYEHLVGIAGCMVYGFKRIKYSDTRDTGVIALSTYAAPHTN